VLLYRPFIKIDKDYTAKLDELPTPADKAAALEAAFTVELSEEDGLGFLRTYRFMEVAANNRRRFGRKNSFAMSSKPDLP
jgi:hypothetical protein